MKLNSRQIKLFKYVKQQHGDQVRKYTGEPYYNHLYSVAEIVAEYDSSLIEVALCHDLFEDTKCNFEKLYGELVNIGYSRNFAYDTCKYVLELTDKYTPEEFPYLNRAQRKAEEAKLLSTINPKSMTVKYADIIDNTSSILAHDKEFAEVYLKEAAAILDVMTGGNPELLKRAKETIA